MTFGFIDWLGYIGGAVLLFAFWRTSIGKWTGKSLWYELDNLIAGILLTVYTFDKRAYASVIINLVWAVVAFRGVTSYAERRMRTKR
ncbi:MAG TPA: hypothetical protein VLF64_00700 [Candidatus Saccharimonadales bacterium]|nr:hypothetical protein [Candidatus Saccharimonadales bacterium]